MTENRLKKDNIKPLLMEASKQWETYVPVEAGGGDVSFAKLDSQKKGLSVDTVNLDYKSLAVPPKVIAFPQLECLFEFQDAEITETVRPPVKRLLFGLRACDVKAILFLDDFFKRNYEDIYYLNRSMNKLLVIAGCKVPLENCFCSSAGTGPFLETGFDLQLVDVGNEYLVEVGSEKGEEFVNTYRAFFTQASKDDVRRSEAAKRQAQQAVPLRLDFQEAVKRFCEDKVPRQLYQRIAERCIYCGGCVYICPTCSCFNVFDERVGDFGRRYRNWDGCMFAGYSREASGHNPRQPKWIRTSRRYEHKLKYDYQVTGKSGCVGCGRCLSACPVKIGISQVIEEVAKS